MIVEVASELVDVVAFFSCAGIFPHHDGEIEGTKGWFMPVVLPPSLLFAKASRYTQLAMASHVTAISITENQPSLPLIRTGLYRRLLLYFPMLSKLYEIRKIYVTIGVTDKGLFDTVEVEIF